MNTPHPMAVTVFQNKVYYADWTKMGLCIASKYNRGNITITQTTKKIVDIAIIHKLRQPKSKF